VLASLDGAGQIIGTSDTGIDYDSCFFHDASTPVPVNHVNPAHRKIVAYWVAQPFSMDLISLPNEGDDEVGHGTHTAATLAGNAPPGSIASRYNGIAPNAKLAVTDLARDWAALLGLPKAIGAIWNRAYAAGARVHSDSWVSTGKEYKILDWSIDEFCHEHQDFLSVLPAGNLGIQGPRSIHSPGSAKNTIVVGASMTNKENVVERMSEFSAIVSSRGTSINMLLKAAVDFGADLSTFPLTSAELVVLGSLCDESQWSTFNQHLVKRVVLAVERGNCTFSSKARRAQRWGAMAVVVMNYDDRLINMAGEAGTVLSDITIPVVTVRW
jgi:hypothetical protein